MGLQMPAIVPEEAPIQMGKSWKVFFNNEEICPSNSNLGPKGLQQIRTHLYDRFHLQEEDYYFLCDGRKVSTKPTDGDIYVIPRLVGGKGGFGSMLRAIGAQIEKTTNREACRDLSGRRLRDINEEQRLKKWVSQQAEREKEAKEKKKKKLEKLLEKPRHEFKDAEYDKERSALPEQVEDAVVKGLEASCSTTKRKPETDKSKIPKKKPKLWIDSELDEDLSSSSGESDEELKDKKSDDVAGKSGSYMATRPSEHVP